MNIGGLRVLAAQHVDITPNLRHIEAYTTSGLLSVLWHGDRRARRVVLAAGGAMGGLLGPGGGFYHWLGEELVPRGISTMRVSYRRPNDLGACIDDVVAAGLMAENEGAECFVTVGHSFGGAVALNVALTPGPLADSTKGVALLATQSAGCEGAAGIGTRPLLLVHGTHDQILPVWASEAVNEISGGRGDLRIVDGGDHLLGDLASRALLRELLPRWIETAFAG